MGCNGKKIQNYEQLATLDTSAGVDIDLLLEPVGSAPVIGNSSDLLACVRYVLLHFAPELHVSECRNASRELLSSECIP